MSLRPCQGLVLLLSDLQGNCPVLCGAKFMLISTTRETRGEIANEIYREVIPRYLTSMLQLRLERITRDHAYRLPNNRFNLHDLLKGFRDYYRENSGALAKSTQYEEAAHELLL